MRTFVVIGVLLAAVLTSCGPCGPTVTVEVVSNRSGPVSDDYVEEPISARSAKYARALEVSNECVEFLKAGDAEQLRTKYYDGTFIARESLERTVEIVKSIEEQLGKIREYKPMQWSFAVRTDSGKPLLVSTKLVECEKGRIRVLFVFDDDGSYDSLVGMHIRRQNGVHRPGY